MQVDTTVTRQVEQMAGKNLTKGDYDGDVWLERGHLAEKGLVRNSGRLGGWYSLSLCPLDHRWMTQMSAATSGSGWLRDY